MNLVTAREVKIKRRDYKRELWSPLKVQRAKRQRQKKLFAAEMEGVESTETDKMEYKKIYIFGEEKIKMEKRLRQLEVGDGSLIHRICSINHH